MVHPCENVDLPVDSHQLAPVGEKLLLVGLEGHIETCLFMSGSVDLSEGSLADGETDREIV